MSDLISGREAAIAYLDGEEVLCANRLLANGECEWWSCEGTSIDEFKNNAWAFKLKPKTVKIDIEIPAPFDPKAGDRIWYLTQNESGYRSIVLNHSGDAVLGIGCWRTEEEIKQVVALLRGSLK